MVPSSRGVGAPNAWPCGGCGGRRAAAKRSLPARPDEGRAFASSAGTTALGGSAGSPSLPPQTVNGRTFAEMEITAPVYPDFCLAVPVRKQGACWKPYQAPSLYSGGAEAGGEGVASFPASDGDAKAQHPLPRHRAPWKTRPSLPVGGVPVLSVSQPPGAAPCPGQQTKSGYRGARLAPGFGRAEKRAIVPARCQPRRQPLPRTGVAQAAWRDAAEPAAAAPWLGWWGERQPWSSSAWPRGWRPAQSSLVSRGAGRVMRGAGDRASGTGGQSDSRDCGAGTSKAQTSAGQREFAKKWGFLIPMVGLGSENTPCTSHSPGTPVLPWTVWGQKCKKPNLKKSLSLPETPLAMMFMPC